MKATVRRILNTYASASDRDVAAGIAWYPNARELAFEIAGEYVMGAGVIAALSPQCYWERNIQLARDVFNDHIHGHTGDTLNKVRRILQSNSPDEVLPRNKKTWHFYHTIIDPMTQVHVVIDRHAADIAEGVIRGNGPRYLGAPKYRELSADYLTVARYVGRPVSEIQAVTWVAHVNRER